MMLDVGDWWMFYHVFLLLDVPLIQSMEGFLGWVTEVVSDLLKWVVGVWASPEVVGGGGPIPVLGGFHVGIDEVPFDLQRWGYVSLMLG